MTEAKIYRVQGHYRKNKRNIPLTMDIRATKEREVLEKVFAEVGSRHGVKRKDIMIPKKGGLTVIKDPSESRMKEFEDLDSEDFEM